MTTEGTKLIPRLPARRRPRVSVPLIPGVFVVYLIECKARNSRTLPWCATGDRWYAEKAPARAQADEYRARHGKTHVYRIRRYLPTAEVVRG